VITALLEGAEGLRPGAFLVFEIGAGQADAVAREVERRRAFDLLGIAPDFAGIPRVVVLRRRG